MFAPLSGGGRAVPLRKSSWRWSASLVSSQTPGVSAVQLRRQLGLSRYETAFQILHKLRAGMVRPDQDRIGGRPGEHVEVDETWAGGRTHGKGRGVHDKVLVASAVEVRQRKPGTKLDKGADRHDRLIVSKYRLDDAGGHHADAILAGADVLDDRDVCISNVAFDGLPEFVEGDRPSREHVLQMRAPDTGRGPQKHA